jgi:TatD DNase family protein
MEFIDTHSHLYAEEFDEDRQIAIERCIEKGVKKIFLPNVDSQSIDRMLKLESAFPENCFAMMGLHPCSVNQDFESEIETIKSWLEKRNFIAIGEIGIDLYWDKTFVAEQIHCFETQIKLALQYNLPIVIHCRDAFDEIYSVLKKFTQLPKGIFHCFSGTIQQANQIIELGNFKLGIGGVLTFKNSGLDEVVKNIDLNHLVLETDSPYLSPAPHRGKRNESSYLLIIGEKLAVIKNTTIEEIAEITSENALQIFNLKN